jgi:sulfotransferase family protein
MRTVWLASFPKSGNTWMRMMIGALGAPADADIDINALPERGGITSGRAPFDYHTLIDSGLLTFDETDRLRPGVYAAQAAGWRDEDDPEQGLEAGVSARFVKSHDSYTYLADGTPLLGGARGADGAVLIVRDPRDVAPSFANHSSTSLDEAIKTMGDPASSFCGQPERQANQLRQQLLGWSGFAASYLEQRDIPLLLVRYEDMQTDAAGELGRVMTFAGDPQPPEVLARAAELSDFDRLKQKEAESGFREAPSRIRAGFFRRGQSGAWKDELTPEQVARIEADHAPMMRRLGYELAG